MQNQPSQIEQRQDDTSYSEYSNAFLEAECAYGNQCFQICSNKQCQESALVCVDQNCKCHIPHQEKLCAMISPKAIVKKLLNKKANPKSLMQAVEKLFSNIVDWISDFEERFIGLVKAIGLEKDENIFLNIIEEKRFKELNGKMIDSIKNTIGVKTDNLKRIEERIKEYGQKTELQIKSLIGKMQTILLSENKLVGVKNDKMDLIPNSKVLGHNADYIKRLMGFFQKSDQILGFDLLYRASDHNFDATKFHQLCDNIPHTLLIAKTQYGKIIGGYTPSQWNRKGAMIADLTFGSFIFSLTNNHKFTLNDRANAIGGAPNGGPLFGNGYDLFVPSNCKANKSRGKIGVTYTHPDYKTGQRESYEKFSGGSSDQFFIHEWEVFRVVFE